MVVTTEKPAPVERAPAGARARSYLRRHCALPLRQHTGLPPVRVGERSFSSIAIPFKIKNRQDAGEPTSWRTNLLRERSADARLEFHESEVQRPVSRRQGIHRHLRPRHADHLFRLWTGEWFEPPLVVANERLVCVPIFFRFHRR